jgi:hypothetical protein
MHSVEGREMRMGDQGGSSPLGDQKDLLGDTNFQARPSRTNKKQKEYVLGPCGIH